VRPSVGRSVTCSTLSLLCAELVGLRLVVGRSACVHSRQRSPTASRSDPSGRRDPRICLGIGRPSKTPLDDIELKRGEDLDKD
jgi:hypothetical protein